MEKYIINYNDSNIEYVYGGKANSLLRLIKEGFPVPKFIVLSSYFFKSFINYNNIKTNNFDELCKEIDNGNFSNDMIIELFKYWDIHKFEKVSVRSSAANEDGNEKSFAGQYATFLNITKNELLVAIKNCWKSLYKKNVYDYQGKSEFSYEMNVIIQEMVDADYAGVAISTDNMLSTRYYSYVETCKGTGEKLVSGEMTPTKYFLRKSNNSVDYIVGEKYPIEKELHKLSILINKIERIYEKNMDIEWAFYNKQVYILQARPVTSFPEFKIPFSISISRPRPLAAIQCAEICEREGLRNILGGMYYFNTLYYYRNNTFEEYNNMLDIEQIPSVMIHYAINHKQEMFKLLDNANKKCKQLEKEVIEDGEFNIRKIISYFKEFIPFNLLSNFAEKTTIITNFETDMNDSLIKQIIKNREHYDDIKYKVDKIIIEKIKSSISEELKPYVNLLTIEEAFEGKRVTIEELENRKNGFIYYKEDLILKKDIDEYFKREKIFIKSDEELSTNNLINGSSAYPGKAKGKVKLVFCEDDLEKINEGDIIVSPMTIPTFINGMKKACAIITDEGGVVCHAALIAREMKKVCVIGTKIATKMLKDDMLVEVNGDLGIVRILDK